MISHQKNNKKVCVGIILILIGFCAFAETVAPTAAKVIGSPPQLSLEVAPEFSIPLGSDSELYGLGQHRKH